ncbi:histidine phosphatase family protein [Bradyrhizobium sp.]|uniref:histidine phosphatase family protein n=1 Tax=Bradyrhizobium sp. TaxID=376 RepID=UPI0039C8A2F9
MWRRRFDDGEAGETGVSTILWLIRHAAVDGPPGTIWPADAPADLGDHASFDRLRARLPKNANAYASPAQRTIATAKALQLDPALAPEFSEQDFGAWTGKRHDDLAATGGQAYAQFWKDPARSTPPGGESFADQIVRVRRGLELIESDTAILVVHSGTVRAALCIALDSAPETALRFVIDPLSLTRIDRLDGGWRVRSVNETFR